MTRYSDLEHVAWDARLGLLFFDGETGNRVGKQGAVMGMRSFVTPVHVADHGAVGDGFTDDTLALRSAIAAGKHIYLEKGKTYLISGELSLNAGQIVYGNNAVLKRRNQVITTTTTPISQGVTTQVVVASAVGLEVGMSLAFSQGIQSSLIAEVTLATNNARIAAIEGTTITLDEPINCSFSGTVDVWSAYYTIVTASDCRLYDLTIDGNRENYTRARWETTGEIRIEGDRVSIENCNIIETPGEAYILTGSYNTIRGGWVLNADGNGVHLSAATHPLIDGLTVVGANLDTTIGHAGGCIASSALFTDTTVTNCYLKDGLAGIGFSAASASHNTFSNNTIRNCDYGIVVSGDCSNLVITGNRIYDCATRGIELVAITTGMMIVSQNQVNDCGVKISSSGDAEKTIQFSNNQIITGDFIINGVTGLKANNNTIVSGQISIQSGVHLLDLTGNTVDNTGNTTRIGIALLNSGYSAINIQNNTILEGAEGIQLGCASAVGVKVIGNTCRGQLNHGIYTSLNGAIPGCIIASNYIEATLASANSWQGIGGAAYNLQITGNNIYGMAGHANYGILISGTGTGTALVGNYVRGAFGNNTIRLLSGTGIVCMNNITTALILDNATDTVLVNNQVVA